MSHSASVWEKDYYSQGFAVCEHNIINDTTYCRFRDEEFEFDNRADIDALIFGRGPLAENEPRKSMIYAEVAKLRALKRKA